MPKLYLKEIEPFLLASEKTDLTEKGRPIKNVETAGQKVFNRHSTKRNTSLIATDAMLLILELLQVLALLQAMSLKWFWPKSWVKNTNFIFLFNMDIWEFIKVCSFID